MIMVASSFQDLSAILLIFSFKNSVRSTNIGPAAGPTLPALTLILVACVFHRLFAELEFFN